jgi:beta-galactosidase/beta-glucuronidase
MRSHDNSWGFLNGTWEFSIDKDGTLTDPGSVGFDRKIVVPFAPESPAAGVVQGGVQGFFKAVWYRRTWPVTEIPPGHRLLLHFGAVDYIATVYVNGQRVCCHEGGYSPFHVDVTDIATSGSHGGGDGARAGDLEIVVHAVDDPHDMAKPRGKQDWHEKPHAIWYPRTTGIWQSVWWEVVPESWVGSLRWEGDALKFEVGFDVRIDGQQRAGQKLRVELAHGARALGAMVVDVIGGKARGKIHIADPGIGDARGELLWAPWSPNLIQARVALLENDVEVDEITSYTALRHVKLEAGRVWLNGGPIRLDLVLDQGYWQDSGLTPPDDAAIRRDVELTKALGFNGVRKHQKLEDPRFLYWADHLGLFVWSEFPGCYAFTQEAVARTTRQWLEAIERDVSHPCIIAWVPFNESWGVPDLPDSAAQRALVDGIYHLTKAFDPTRPVIGNDGWELCTTDILAIHDYDADPKRLRDRYRDRAHFMAHERPGNKLLGLPQGGYDYSHQPVLLTEFGGIAFSQDYQGTWGYSRAKTSEDLAARYARLLQHVRDTPIFGGFCYTQLTDTYQEANGLLYMDRTPKFDLRLASIATRGAGNEKEWEEPKELMGR